MREAAQPCPNKAHELRSCSAPSCIPTIDIRSLDMFDGS